VKGRSENARFETSAQTESPPDAHSSRFFALYRGPRRSANPKCDAASSRCSIFAHPAGSDRRKGRSVREQSEAARAPSAIHRPKWRSAHSLSAIHRAKRRSAHSPSAIHRAKRRSAHSPVGLPRRKRRSTRETSSIHRPPGSFSDPNLRGCLGALTSDPPHPPQTRNHWGIREERKRHNNRVWRMHLRQEPPVVSTMWRVWRSWTTGATATRAALWLGLWSHNAGARPRGRGTSTKKAIGSVARYVLYILLLRRAVRPQTRCPE
jgi:hypothetical protein